MTLLLWGFGTLLVGIIFFLWNLATFQQLKQVEKEDQPQWQRFLLMVIKIDTVKSFGIPIVFILLGLLFILESLGVL
ncbi:MAG: hypothetical protein ACQEXQ_20670 [Bacillota bacterium]